MKKFIGWMLLVCSVCTTQAQFSKAVIQASGLTCAMCSKAIDNSLKQLPFVSSISPDIKNSAFTVVFKPGQPADIDALKIAVEDAGFFVAKFTITGVFTGTAIHNDALIAVDGKEFHFLNVKDQVLQGETNLVLVDKNFLTATAFKKYTAATSMQCIKTGRAGDCCTKDGVAAGTRIYHVTI